MSALLMYIISMLSAFKLRKREPELERPVKALFYPTFPILALVLSAVSMAAMIYYNVLISILFFGGLLVAIIFFWWLKDKRIAR